MRQRYIAVPTGYTGEELPTMHHTSHDASIGELLKRLTSDSAELIQKEVELARTEMRESAAGYARDASNIGIAAGLSFVGVLTLSAFLVIGLGNIMGGRYWLSSLFVGVVAAGVGYMMVNNAVSAMKHREWKPRETMQTLQEDKAWVGQQARELERDMMSHQTTPSISN